MIEYFFTFPFIFPNLKSLLLSILFFKPFFFVVLLKEMNKRDKQTNIISVFLILVYLSFITVQ